MEEEINLIANRYRVLAQIGSGGYGAVYKAIDTLKGKAVAIKAIHIQGLSADAAIDATDSFHREVSLLKGLNHPHIPHVYDQFTDAGHWYLMLQFVAGETLEAYLSSPPPTTTHPIPADTLTAEYDVTRQLPQDEVVGFAIQLCNVLQYLHTYAPPIIYRDLKPSNIMRTPEGDLYLIDFGAARYYKKNRAHDTIPLGSPGYAAPEQYGKEQTTPRTDVYGLGVLLHQMLSGKDPSQTPFQHPVLQLAVQEGSAELEELIAKMIQLDPSNRPVDIHSVMARLYRVQSKQRAAERSKHSYLNQGNQSQITMNTGNYQYQLQAVRKDNPHKARQQRKKEKWNSLHQGYNYKIARRERRWNAILEEEEKGRERLHLIEIVLLVLVVIVAIIVSIFLPG